MQKNKLQKKNKKRKEKKGRPCRANCFWHYLHCGRSASTDRASVTARAAGGALSNSQPSTGPPRSASTTGASVVTLSASASVGQTSVQPLPLPEPLPSSPATSAQREAAPISSLPRYGNHTLLVRISCPYVCTCTGMCQTAHLSLESRYRCHCRRSSVCWSSPSEP